MKKILYFVLLVGFVACNSGTKENTKEVKPVAIVEATIDIGGMHCSDCVASVEKGINSLAGIEEVQVALEDSTAVVKYNASAVSIVEIRESIEKRGYSVKEVE